MNGPENIVKSPCVRNCCLDDEDICLGCFRSMDEIVHWNVASDAERRTILENARKRKEAHRSKVGDYFKLNK
jgi:predicted Fe-S protein YdhL (DUF1289 family)